jgi:hypothetical protein
VFDWLFEGRLSVYIFLFLIVCVLLVLWWQRRDRRLLKGVVAVGFVTLLYFVLDRVAETPQEKVEATIKDMADAVGKNDLDRLFGHIANNFNYRGKDKKAFRERVQAVLKEYSIKNVRLKEIRFLKMDLDAGRMTVRISATAETNQEWGLAMPCEGDFVREGDGQWRMKAIRFYHPVLTDDEWDVPGL